jgi:hypothetical protein
MINININSNSKIWEAYCAYTPTKEIPVYTIVDGKFRKVDSRVLGGLSVNHKTPGCIRIILDGSLSKERLHRELSMVEKTVATLTKGRWKTCPTPPWVKRMGNMARYDLLFAETGEEADTKSSKFSRRAGGLDFQADAKSFELGEARRVKISDHPLIQWHDGTWYVRSSTIVMPTNPMKVLGESDRTAFGEPVAKGMVRELNPIQWDWVCKKIGVDASAYDAIVPLTTLKFADERNEMSLSVMGVQKSMWIKHATFAQQLRSRAKFTPQARKLVNGLERAAICFVMAAYRDESGETVKKLMAKAYDRLLEDAENGVLTEEEREEMKGLSATLKQIMLYPLKGSDFINKTIKSMLQSYVKSIRIPGAQLRAMPGFGLKSLQIRVSKRVLIANNWKIGDKILIIRYPVTGIECIVVTIVGTTDMVAMECDAETLAFLKGDVDGDILAITDPGKILDTICELLGVTMSTAEEISLVCETCDCADLAELYRCLDIDNFIDMKAVRGTRATKEKRSGDMTVIEANARALYSKLNIPEADRFLSLCIEHGKDTAIAEKALQSMVDMNKQCIDPVNIQLEQAKLGLGKAKLSDYAQLTRGAITSATKQRLAHYNLLVSQTEGEYFEYIVAPDKYTMNGYYGEQYLQEVVERLGIMEYVNTNIDVNETLPKAIVDTYKPFAAQEIERMNNHKLKHLTEEEIKALTKEQIKVLTTEHSGKALKIVNEYLNKFIGLIQQARYDEAYEVIREWEVSEETLKYLFLAIAFGVDPAIQYRKFTIFGYLPLAVGKFSIPNILKRIGYKRKVSMRCLDHLSRGGKEVLSSSEEPINEEPDEPKALRTQPREKKISTSVRTQERYGIAVSSMVEEATSVAERSDISLYGKSKSEMKDFIDNHVDPVLSRRKLTDRQRELAKKAAAEQLYFSFGEVE